MTPRHERDRADRWMLLARLFGTGTHRAHLLCERYGDAKEIFSLTPARLAEDKFFSPQERASLLSPDWTPIEAEIDLAERRGAVLLTPDSPEYPEGLRNIHSMPMVLYARGDLSLLTGRYLVGMVGSRSPDEYGRAAAKKLAGEIAALGGVVVSGLAIGTDAACHQAALDAGGGTIAFLAAGLDVDYPRKNRALRREIEERGLVLTEYPFGVPALGGHFPVRNRLISGVSVATVIVQCAQRSGTMLTAGHALTQGRDLFAVPGSILSPMDGGNALLLQGAEPALSGGQILLRYPAVYGYPLEAPAGQTEEPAGGPGTGPEPKTEPPPETEPQTATGPKTELPPKTGQRPGCHTGSKTGPQPKTELQPRPKTGPEPETEPPEEVPTPADHSPPDYLSEEQARVYAALCGKPAPLDLLCEQCRLSAGALLPVLTQLELFGLVRLLPGRMAQAVGRS